MPGLLQQSLPPDLHVGQPRAGVRQALSSKILPYGGLQVDLESAREPLQALDCHVAAGQGHTIEDCEDAEQVPTLVRVDVWVLVLALLVLLLRVTDEG